MLETVEICSGKNNPVIASVICLHGLGADGNDLAPIVPALNLPDNLNIRFVFPHAPLRRITINNGALMPAWYDVKLPSIAIEEDKVGIQESAEQVKKLIEQEKLRGISAQNIFLAGFSQGAAMTLQVGLRYPERLAGLMCLSGYLPLHDTLNTERTMINQDIPLLIAHGTLDPIIPYAINILSREKLISLGYSVEWHEYAMAHQLCNQEIQDMCQWITRVLT